MTLVTVTFTDLETGLGWVHIVDEWRLPQLLATQYRVCRRPLFLRHEVKR